MNEDIRSAEYQATHPEFKEAMRVICDLKPVQFVAMVRYAIELRQAIEQAAHVAASNHFRLTRD